MTTLQDINKQRIQKSFESMYESQIPTLEKGGEGSRGGKVIRHTKSGKPIYSEKHANDYKDFSKQDHKDAEEAHEKKNLEHYNKSKTVHDNDAEEADHDESRSEHHHFMSMGHRDSHMSSSAV